jgi:hypothetical protein
MAKPKRQSVAFVAHEAVDSYTSFEKFSHSARPAMPVGSNRQSIRSARKTSASQRVGKKFSLTLGGIHRRRNKRSF